MKEEQNQKKIREIEKKIKKIEKEKEESKEWLQKHNTIIESCDRDIWALQSKIFHLKTKESKPRPLEWILGQIKSNCDAFLGIDEYHEILLMEYNIRDCEEIIRRIKLEESEEGEGK